MTKGALVLNVDDSEDLRYIKTRMLESAGFKVAEAATGADALRLVGELRPDLVLLDVNLPDMSGLKVCAAIKSDRQTHRIPVAHVSATAVSLEDEARGLEGGADVYLSEPVDQRTLITVVRTLVRLRSAERGLAASEERMRLATEGAGIATWDIDLAGETSVWSDGLYRMLGYEPGAVAAGWPAWEHRIHPEDAAQVRAALAATKQAGEPFNAEHRLLVGGVERYVAPFGKLHSDSDGYTTRFIGVLVDVSTRRQIEAGREQMLMQARAAREAAEEAARLKDEFLAMLSHELRNPMHVILTLLGILGTGRLEAADSARALETIHRNALLQGRLIDDLLDISAIAGKIVLDLKQVSLRELIELVLASARLNAGAKGIEVHSSVEGNDLLIDGDSARLQQVLGNLLTNAIKFTAPGGRIRIDARREKEYAEVRVSDNGEGIAPESLPHIFDAFRQADTSVARRHGGLGLGLAIVRRLVELHGGFVSASSAGPGRGTCITLRLPTRQSASAAD
jgi:PAS domain S-box-containing protein